jgi:pentatricopeptide repeat protein
MLAEGCAPNLVTYNTLIDLYVKTGQWREAVAVLDKLEAEVRRQGDYALSPQPSPGCGSGGRVG